MNKVKISDIKKIIKSVIKENLETEPNDVKTEIKNGIKGLFSSLKDEYKLSFPEFANIVCFMLSKYQDGKMNENNPKPAPAPSPGPGPSTLPGKPAPNPGPRRPLVPPHTIPNPTKKPKAEGMLEKITQRYKKLKK